MDIDMGQVGRCWLRWIMLLCLGALSVGSCTVAGKPLTSDAAVVADTARDRQGDRGAEKPGAGGGLAVALGDAPVVDDSGSVLQSERDGGVVAGSDARSTTPQPPLVRVHNGALYDEHGVPFKIRGIAFENDVYAEAATAPRYDHTEQSFAELSSAGFNTVRFYLNYQLLEDDVRPRSYKESGWAFIDQSIDWAKQHGMYILLNMHVPQGGFQSNGDGMRLWQDRRNQLRLIDLWRVIAKRYRDEKAVLGYGMVNEPVVPKLGSDTASIAAWGTLAGEIATAIRAEDANHILFVERVCGVKDIGTGSVNWGHNLNGQLNFVSISDKNTVYEFHYYDPVSFTAQLAPWISPPFPAQSYPDPYDLQFSYVARSGDVLNVHSYGWVPLHSEIYHHSGDKPLIGKVALEANNLGAGGYAWFDDVRVAELDGAGKFVRYLASFAFDAATASDTARVRNWHYWSRNGVGSWAFDEAQGATGVGSLRVDGSTADANLTDSEEYFILQPGRAYRIDCMANKWGVANEAVIRPRIDVFDCSAHNPTVPTCINNDIAAYADWGQRHGVPVFAGEFGSIISSFENDRGGERWVADVMQALKLRGVGFSYHSYHDKSAYGLYYDGTGVEGPPTTRNQALWEVFVGSL